MPEHQTAAEMQRAVTGEWFRARAAVLAPSEPARYPPVETASNDKDGMPLPMTGRTAVRRRQDMVEATRQARAAVRDAALGRALQWTGHWGG